jgi:hypothetical protein
MEVLRRIATERPPVVEGERCEMCAEVIEESHRHVVNLDSRSLLCTCRGCYLLFTAAGAEQRYRAVPDRYLSFPSMSPAQWGLLEIPVGLVFFFYNSSLGRIVAFYPGPTGAAESELPLGEIDNPAFTVLAPDVEALLIRMPDRRSTAADCHLVPIDACYELVGKLRKAWRGFDGGQDARAEMDRFFATVAARSKVL